MYIFIEGNIGVGKNTLLEPSEKNDGTNIAVIPEMIEKWQHLFGPNLLDQFHKNRKEKIFNLQSFIQLCSLESPLTPSTKPIKMFHRSVAANYMIFTRLGMLEQVL